MVGKFERLAVPLTDAALRREIVQAVVGLETMQVADLMRLLAKVQVTAARIQTAKGG